MDRAALEKAIKDGNDDRLFGGDAEFLDYLDRADENGSPARRAIHVIVRHEWNPFGLCVPLDEYHADCEKFILQFLLMGAPREFLAKYLMWYEGDWCGSGRLESIDDALLIADKLLAVDLSNKKVFRRCTLSPFREQ